MKKEKKKINLNFFFFSTFFCERNQRQGKRAAKEISSSHRPGCGRRKQRSRAKIRAEQEPSRPLHCRHEAILYGRNRTDRPHRDTSRQEPAAWIFLAIS